jgi:hypothetical protein
MASTLTPAQVAQLVRAYQLPADQYIRATCHGVRVSA